MDQLIPAFRLSSVQSAIRRTRLDVRHVFDDREQARVVEFAAAFDHRRFEEFKNLAGDGQGHAEVIARFLDDVEVFVVQADAKARVEIAVDHALAPVLEHAATREPAAEDLDDFERIDARFRAHREGFGDACDGDGDEDLVARFHGLPCAEGAAQDRALAHDVKERFDGVECVCVAADHDGEGGVLRADVAAADGCIQAFDAFFCERISHLNGRAGRDGAHIDEDHALVRAFDNAARA